MSYKITFECETKDCGHTVQVYPVENLHSTYAAACGGCDHEYVIRAFEVPSLDPPVEMPIETAPAPEVAQKK